jgi:hypothetical protein
MRLAWILYAVQVNTAWLVGTLKTLVKIGEWIGMTAIHPQ